MHLTRILISLTTIGILAACNDTTTATGEAPPQTVAAVTVAPSEASVGPSEQVAFTAAVTGTIDKTVRWTVTEVGGGTIDSTGRYVAPSSGGTFHVVAESVANATARGIATVTVTVPPPPVVTVSVSPATAAVDACQSVTLSATVGGSSNQAVGWTIQEAPLGGAITPEGVYTAPDTAGVYHAVATSAADPTKAAIATLTVSERVVAVQVVPGSVEIQSNGAAQFSANVTTTCGTFTTSSQVAVTGRVGVK